MRHEAFDIGSIDIQSLNSAQRDALKRHLIRRAHAARMQAIREIFADAAGSRPVMVVTAMCNAIGRLWAAYVRRRDRVEGLARLRAMTDYELRDIALSRCEIGAAVRSDQRDTPPPGCRQS